MTPRPGTRAGRSARWANVVLTAVTALAMLMVILLVIRTVETERDQRVQARQTSAIVDELRAISRASLNAETGQRGYLLSLDRRYLAPFYSGRDRIGPSLRRLRSLLEPRANVRQLALIDRIDKLSRAKFTELERSVALVEKGELIEARRQVLTDEGQEAMERLRAAIGDLEAIELALLANAVAQAEQAESRVMPLLAGLLALLTISLIGSARLIARGARAEAIAAQAEALSAARDRADLLAHELNHRVKNLFAVVLAIVKLSARDAPAAKPVTDGIANRIMALLKAHEVSQGELGKATVSLAALVETSLAPYRSESLTATIEGPEVTLDARSITPLGLLLHELTTNAVKYGSWSQPSGAIRVAWERQDGEVVLRWHEHGKPLAEPPARQGFGSQLMTSSAHQLGGSVEREFASDGARIAIRFPV